MIIEWENWEHDDPLKDYEEESLLKWYTFFRFRITFYGPDRNEFGKDLFETYLKD